jgi:hypothetical protein
LAALDAWLVHSCPELLDGRGLIVDFGYGESPITTLELAEAIGRPVTGIEQTVSLSLRGGERVGERGCHFLEGDFATCATLGPTSVVRAMNVLRGYREEEVPALHEALGAALIEGGLLLEGSTDTEGHVTVVGLMRKRSGHLRREALLFHTDFSRGFSPWLFRDWLPRDLRRSVRPGTAIHSLLSTWDSQVQGDGPRERFAASVYGVVEATAWELAHGFARAPASPS